MDLNSVSNRHRKFQNTDLTPTVIIFVRSGSRHIWSQVEEEIRKEIVSVSVPDDVEVNVEILLHRMMDGSFRTFSYFIRCYSR
jgi:hypothetical protein